MPLCRVCDEQVTPLLMNMRRNCLSSVWVVLAPREKKICEATIGRDAAASPRFWAKFVASLYNFSSNSRHPTASLDHPGDGRWKDGAKKHLRSLWRHLLVACVLHSRYTWRRGASVVSARRPRWPVLGVHRLSGRVVPCYPVRTRGFPWGTMRTSKKAKTKRQPRHVSGRRTNNTPVPPSHKISFFFICTFLKVWGEFASDTERILRHCCLFL